MVGMLDIFQGLGQRLLADGYATPFLSAPLAYMAPTLADNEKVMQTLGRRIATEGLPAGVGPLVFTFTGRGNVGRGARKIINHLPVQEVRRMSFVFFFLKRSETKRAYPTPGRSELMFTVRRW